MVATNIVSYLIKSGLAEQVSPPGFKQLKTYRLMRAPIKPTLKGQTNERIT